MSKRVKIIFLISLVSNLLLLGVVGGHFMRRQFDHPHFASPNLEELNVSPEALERASEVMREIRESHQDLRESVRTARKKALTLLTAENFDPDAYMTQVQAMHEIRSQMMLTFSKDIQAAAEQMTAEERRALAALFRYRRPPPPNAEKDD